jgi:hypothetical protein
MSGTSFYTKLMLTTGLFNGQYHSRDT